MNLDGQEDDPFQCSRHDGGGCCPGLLLWWGIGSYGVIFAGCLGLLTAFRITGFRPRRKSLEFNLQSAAVDEAAGVDKVKDPITSPAPGNGKSCVRSSISP